MPHCTNNVIENVPVNVEQDVDVEVVLLRAAVLCE